MLNLMLICFVATVGGAILWRVYPPFKRWMGGDFNKTFGGTIYTYSFYDSKGERHVRDFGRPLTPIEAEKFSAYYKAR